ncbi:deoxynucleoside triphosphate triphosphohydrolase SAMHD1-like isoform X1 [Artemia franciscana]|uniref:deoxynucleoside triphosphate triphosphohydrolase SAMHD1-like isoform X1 n=1 Tax=Artemia franciscana TaxID=6661 RepID=UPI0032D9D22A
MSQFQDSKVFKDSIHGVICLSPLLVSIIDTPQFQRLRNIKQLGGTYWVFPSSSHNRFEHSLGVCYLGGEMLEKIRSRQPELGITDSDILCVQIAGLCHDLGHGPFSHLWEHFMENANPEAVWKHEECSIKMLDFLIKKNELEDLFHKNDITSRDLIFIKELIVGPDSNIGDDWPYKGRDSDKAFLYEIIANKRNGVDVDKWDYFLRDAHALGLRTSFGYERLLQFVRVIDVPGEGRQVCFRDKDAYEIYEMFHTREALHRRAYQHRVCKVIERMLVDIFLLADKHIKLRTSEGPSSLRLSEVYQDPSVYTRLNDSILDIIGTSYEPELEPAQKLVERLERRQLYTFVGAASPCDGRLQISDSDIEKKLISYLDPKDSFIQPSDVVVTSIHVNFGQGDKNPLEFVRFYTKCNPDVAKPIRKEEISKMLPDRFTEEVIHVHSKRRDSAIVEALKRCLDKFCEDNLFLRHAAENWFSTVPALNGVDK